MNGVTFPMRKHLSGREREVVALACAGHENKAIAFELGLAHSTVRVLMARAARKIGARTRQGLIETASVVTKEPGELGIVTDGHGRRELMDGASKGS
jgi:DNA-binding CsgD family transcriptional regulator